MSNLIPRILALEAALQQVTDVISRIQTSTIQEKIRCHGQEESSSPAPPWADELAILLAQASAKLGDVKEEVSRSAPSGERVPWDGASAAVSSLQPGSVDTSQRPAGPPTQAASPAYAMQVPFPCWIQQSASTSQGEQPGNDLPASSLAENTSSASNLTPLPLAYDNERPALSIDQVLGTANELPLAATSPSSAEPHSISKFSLAVADMGHKFTINIAKIIGDGHFDGHIRIEGLEPIDWSRLAARANEPKYREQLAVEYSSDPVVKGCSRLRLSSSADFKFPGFLDYPQAPSIEEMWNYLDGLANDPPKQKIPYYVGPPLTADFTSLLHPGEELLQLQVIEGVNTDYWHVGGRGSGTAWHVEDAQFRSSNLVLFGWKLWILVDDSHTTIFEDFVRRHWKTNHCAQCVRHLSLFISPTMLQKEGINFQIKCAGPGDMIVTSPGQYHAVVNFCDCFAVAINFLLPGEEVIPGSIPVCKQCGLFPLENQGLREVSSPLAEDETRRQMFIKEKSKMKSTRHPAQLRPMRQQAQLRPIKEMSKEPAMLRRKKKLKLLTKAPSQGSGNQEIEQAWDQITKVDKLCSVLPYIAQLPSPVVYKLAAMIYSRLTVFQFCSLVRSRRDLNAQVIRSSFKQDTFARVGQRLDNIAMFQRMSMLGLLYTRLETFNLAQDIEDSKGDGRIRADTNVINRILKQTKCSKSTLERYRARGNRWRRLCKGYDGLLCLIPLDGQNPFGISPASYLQLNDADVDSLRELLDTPYIRSLCSTAMTFQQTFDSRQNDVEFLWEASNSSLEALPEEEMLVQLQPLPSSHGNLFEPDAYRGRPRPPYWPEEWPWPADPTAIIASDETPCDFCEDVGCDCIRKASGLQPRIKYYGQIGRGLQAVASSQGTVAYQSGSLIGFLTGKIVPLGTYDETWALDFVRPDLDDEPVVCQVYCGDVGNCFRLLNHSCKPSAQLKQVKASGRYITAVEAAEDIPDGAEITVNYGKEWAAEYCSCGAHRK